MKADLHSLVAALAAAHNVGTVGIVDRMDCPDDKLRLFVMRPLAELSEFGHELTEASGCAVRLMDAESTPFRNPDHYRVKWCNVDRMPVVPSPRGAIATVKHPNGAIVRVPLDSIPHFAPTSEVVRTRTTGNYLDFPAPALGVFLI